MRLTSLMQVTVKQVVVSISEKETHKHDVCIFEGENEESE